VKRVTRPMLGVRLFDAARSTLAGVEVMHMLRKGQLRSRACAVGGKPSQEKVRKILAQIGRAARPRLGPWSPSLRCGC
jgi:hypothetical protein